MANKEPSLQQKADTEVANLANGTERQVSDVHGIVRRVMLVGFGAVVYGVDQVHALFAHAAERGRQMEDDMQRMLMDASEHSTGAVSSRLASVLNRLPGVRVAYKPRSTQPSQPEGPPPEAPDSKE